MKHVGEAVKDRAHVGRDKDKINVIGIATWGIVDRTDDLISLVRTRKPKFPRVVFCF